MSELTNPAVSPNPHEESNDDLIDTLDEGLFYDRAGAPISSRRWGNLHRDSGYMRIAEDTIGEYWVSTVWVGMNMAYMMADPPLIFETMVFGEDGDKWSGEQWRWSTSEEAKSGHKWVVGLLRKERVWWRRLMRAIPMRGKHVER